jgi:hypothetical protein
MPNQQFTEAFVVPAVTPFTYQLLHPTGAVLVAVEAASGVAVADCSVNGTGLLTVPSAQASAALWVVYTATASSSYAGSQAQAARGTLLSIGSSPVIVGEIRNYGKVGGDWANVKVTNSQSGADDEFLNTIRDNGTLELEGNRVSADAGQVAVEAAYQDGLKRPFTLTLPMTPTQSSHGDSYSFNALVNKRSFDTDITKEISWTVSLKVTGPMTPLPGA